MEKGYYVPEDFFTPPDGVRQLDLFGDIDTWDEFATSSALDIAKVMDSMIVENIAKAMDSMMLAACIPVALLVETEKR